jgi:hypothetical protein
LRRGYAAVSIWLNGGSPAADVAEWAGHPIEILLKIYAKCLDGGTDLLRVRVDRALAEPDEPSEDQPAIGAPRDQAGEAPTRDDGSLDTSLIPVNRSDRTAAGRSL